MSILHMETQSVRSTGQRLETLGGNMEAQTRQLSRSVLDMDWSGPSRIEFLEEFMRIALGLSLASRQIITLNQRLQREVDEWEQADSSFGVSISNLPSHGTGSPPSAHPIDSYNNFAEYMKQFILYQGDTVLCNTYSQLMILHALGIDVELSDLTFIIDPTMAGFFPNYLLNKYDVETEGVPSENQQQWLNHQLEQRKGIILMVNNDILYDGDKDNQGFLGITGGTRHAIVITGVQYVNGKPIAYTVLDPAQGKEISFAADSLINAWKDIGYPGAATKSPIPLPGNTHGGSSGAW